MHLGEFIMACGTVTLSLQSGNEGKTKHHLDVLRTLIGEHSIMIPLY